PGAASARVQSLDGASSDPERRLRARLPEQVDPLPGPVLRDRRLDSKPERRPRGPERQAELGGPVVDGGRPLWRDVTDGGTDEQRVGRAGLRIDERTNPPGGLSHPLAGVLAVEDRPGHALPAKLAHPRGDGPAVVRLARYRVVDAREDERGDRAAALDDQQVGVTLDRERAHSDP